MEGGYYGRGKTIFLYKTKRRTFTLKQTQLQHLIFPSPLLKYLSIYLFYFYSINKKLFFFYLKFTGACSEQNINISDLINKSKGEYAYTLMDLDSSATKELVNAIEEIEDYLLLLL